MKSKYCLPIIKDSQQEVLDTIEKNLETYGAFEVWLDYIKDLGKDFFDKLNNFDTKIIVLFRRKNLEPIKMYLSDRTKYIQKIAQSKLWLDLDITQHEELTIAKQLNLKGRLIISFHHYSATPDDMYLEKIVGKIRNFKPAVIKVATFCKDELDALRLLKIKRDMLENGEKHIVIGMGEHGKITRVFGALWGNELTFVPDSSEESSAAGQISRAELDKIFERTNIGRK